MIVFENEGEIEVNAIATFGVSVKVGENPIGYFGTGLKYAIAVLLRTDHKVTIYSGLEKIVFSKERVNVRGKDFDFITMGDGDRSIRAGFTTELGRTWQTWMAYRELYCNVRDEGGSVYIAANASSAADPRHDLTQIRVEGEGVEQVHRDAAMYFCEDEPDVIVDGIGIYRRPSQVLFYRGVRVMLLPKPAAFTYNFIDRRIDLTEDRTMAHPFLATWYLARALAQCGDADILEGALAPGRHALEHDFDYKDSSVSVGHTFLAAVGKMKSEGHEGLVVSASEVWRQKVPEQFVPVASHLFPDEYRAFNKAIDLCHHVGFPPEPCIAVEATPGAAPTFADSGYLYVLRERIRVDTFTELAADIIRGCLDRDDISGQAREDRLVTQLISLGYVEEMA